MSLAAHTADFWEQTTAAGMQSALDAESRATDQASRERDAAFYFRRAAALENHAAQIEGARRVTKWIDKSYRAFLALAQIHRAIAEALTGDYLFDLAQAVNDYRSNRKDN